MDLTNPQDVAAYMRQTKTGSVEDWNTRLNEVKKANGGQYPSFWWPAVMASGVHDDIFGTRFKGR